MGHWDGAVLLEMSFQLRRVHPNTGLGRQGLPTEFNGLKLLGEKLPADAGILKPRVPQEGKSPSASPNVL